ncbi:L-seryl-tRNA(Sec) selenium transferase [compost metagenome]
MDQLPSHGLAIRALRTTGKATGDPLGTLEKRLRALPRPVIGRIANDTLWLDLRCLEDAQLDIFIQQLNHLQP